MLGLPISRDSLPQMDSTVCIRITRPFSMQQQRVSPTIIATIQSYLEGRTNMIISFTHLENATGDEKVLLLWGSAAAGQDVTHRNL